jgi:Uma2 family endonuclease
MSAEQVQHPITVEEFLETLPDGVKADLIDGVVHMASPDTPRSDKIAHLIRTLLQGYARRKGGLGEAFGSRVAYAMSRYRSPEPDVSFVLSGRASVIGATRGTGAPDIAVEIVSEDSEQRDYIQKRVLYEEAGVREYWIIDPIRERCTFLRHEGGRFVDVPLSAGRFFHSEVLPGLWLDVEWLLAEPLPDEFACLDRVVAGPPAVP